MYLRFTTQFIDPAGELKTGIFMAIRYLQEDYSMTEDDDIKKLKELTAWFDRNLEKPTRLSNGSSKLNANVSLSWFKSSAKKHIKKFKTSLR